MKILYSHQLAISCVKSTKQLHDAGAIVLWSPSHSSSPRGQNPSLQHTYACKNHSMHLVCGNLDRPRWYARAWHIICAWQTEWFGRSFVHIAMLCHAAPDTSFFPQQYDSGSRISSKQTQYTTLYSHKMLR
jgi:hypothetical protein